MNRPRNSGFSLTELMIVLTALLIVTGLAVPNLIPARAKAKEGSAIATIRHFMNAEAHYAATHGGKFADLNDLIAADLVDESLADGETNGYRFDIEQQETDGYTVTATPIEESPGLQRHFYGDQTGVIRYTVDGSRPTSQSPALGGGPNVILIPDTGF